MTNLVASDKDKNLDKRKEAGKPVVGMRNGYLKMLHFFGNILFAVLGVTGMMAIVDAYLLTRTYLLFNLGMV